VSRRLALVPTSILRAMCSALERARPRLCQRQIVAIRLELDRRAADDELAAAFDGVDAMEAVEPRPVSARINALGGRA
jgi:hypothetical protein